MLLRTRLIEPCLPTHAAKPPSGPGSLHEIKHDGFRLMVRRDGVGARLSTRNGHDWPRAHGKLRIKGRNHNAVQSNRNSGCRCGWSSKFASSIRSTTTSGKSL
jgi:hypothetical protein